MALTVEDYLADMEAGGAKFAPTTTSGSTFNWGDALSGLLGTGINYLGQENAYNALTGLGQAARAETQALGQQLQQQAAGTFKPFTVATGLGGGINVGASGDLQYYGDPASLARQQMMQEQGLGQIQSTLGAGNLTAEQQRIQNMLLGQGIGAAQQDIYSQLEAMRQPERERAQQALQERLFSQGRAGVSTAAYGGTPEQLAMAKAIEEQRAADALTARQQALTEQAQQAGLIGQALGLGIGQQQAQQALGAGGLEAAFAPQQQALSMLQLASPYAELGTRAGLQGVTTRGELEAAGLEALLQAQQNAAALRQQQIQALSSGLFQPQQDSSQSLFSGLFSKIFG